MDNTDRRAQRKRQTGKHNEGIALIVATTRLRGSASGAESKLVGAEHFLMPAKELGLMDGFASQINEQFLRSLERAVPVHDIGKVAAIIVEGSGTQLEPAIVDAFLRHEEDFKRLATQLSAERLTAQTATVVVTA